VAQLPRNLDDIEARCD